MIEAVDYRVAMWSAYNDALEDVRVAVKDWPYHKDGFRGQVRSEWMYDTVGTLSEITGVSFEELSQMEPHKALSTMYKAISEESESQVQCIMGLEAFACGFSTVGPIIEVMGDQ